MSPSVEARLENHHVRIDAVERQVERTDSKLDRIFLVAVGALLSALGHLLLHVLQTKGM